MTPCGGCDAIQPQGLILDLLRKYAAQGHVLFEGLLIGDSYGSVGALLDQLSGEGVSSAVIRLNTPLDECLKRVRRRRAERGDSRPLNPKHTIAHFARSFNSKLAFEAAGSRAMWLRLVGRGSQRRNLTDADDDGPRLPNDPIEPAFSCGAKLGLIPRTTRERDYNDYVRHSHAR